jgi:hypothetical protein
VNGELIGDGRMLEVGDALRREQKREDVAGREMADIQDVRWKEFEDLGEELVRRRLAENIWDEEKAGLARQWLARNAPALPPVPARCRRGMISPRKRLT